MSGSRDVFSNVTVRASCSIKAGVALSVRSRVNVPPVPSTLIVPMVVVPPSSDTREPLVMPAERVTVPSKASVSPGAYPALTSTVSVPPSKSALSPSVIWIAGSTRMAAPSSMNTGAALTVLMTGASLMLRTLTVTVLVAVAPSESVTETSKLSVPKKSMFGVYSQLPSP